MNYSIIQLNNNQHFIEKNNELVLSTTLFSVEEYNIINQLLLLKIFKKIYLGTPYIYNEPIRLILYKIKNIYIRKLLIFKLKSKKKYRRKLGYKDFMAKYNSIVKEI